MAKSSVKRVAAKPAASKQPARPAAKVAAKGKKTTKPIAAKPAAKVATVKPSIKALKSVAVKPAIVKPAAKAAVNGKAVAAKPAINGKAPVNGKAAAPVKPEAKTAKPVNGTPAAEPVKSSGRPMLMQGHVASKSLTKKGTFIPGKLPATVAKPLKRKIDRPEPAFVTLQPPVAQVRTSEKAVKNRAGLNQRDLDFFRDLLLQKRRELVGDMSHMEREALRENNASINSVPVDPTDQGTDAYEQEFTLGLVEKDRTLLREINDAMAKLQNGTYGICEGTGNPIGRPRLEAQPWARHSIEFARILEKRKMVFRR